MKEMLAELQIPKDVKLGFRVPKLHCHTHKIQCQTRYLMNIQLGVGRTDGEGIERFWSILGW